LDRDVIQWLIHFAKQHQKILIIEPVSVTKATQLASLDLDGVFMITPNEAELQAISTEPTTDTPELVAALVARGVQNIWLRQGAKGSTWFSQSEMIPLSVPKITIVDSTGAGDAALAGWVFGTLKGATPLQCLQLGHTLALHILQRKGTVDATMNAKTLYILMKTYYND
jgi:pseudouridine kinase